MVKDTNEMHKVILEIRDEVDRSELVNPYNERYIKMLRATLKKRFDIGSMKSTVSDKIIRLFDENGLEITTKSGVNFGEAKDEDWIVVTHSPVSTPPPEWFDELQEKDFESEREVETYFISPLIEKLGYDYNDVFMDCPVKIFIGKKTHTVKADFVLFNGRGRDARDVLLVVEAKKSDKDITDDSIGQIRAYVKELLPAYYIITTGKRILVFRFNGMKDHDTQVMDFDRSILREKWPEFYRLISKKATIKLKSQMKTQLVVR